MRAAPLLVLAAGAVLAACASLGGGKQANVMPPAIAAPLCAGDYATAATVADSETGEDRFYRAYAMDLAGHGPRARPLYAAIVTGGDRTPVSLSCKGGVPAPANEAAAGRLTAIALQLRAMDAVTDAPFRLHNGLPPTQPVRVAKAATPAPQSKPSAPAKAPARTAAEPVALTAPASHDPNGRWFAHLVSFFEAAEAAESVKGQARRYPALAGMFDTMQVTAKGRDTWRVGVRTSDWADADRLCVAIRASGDYCRVIDTAN